MCNIDEMKNRISCGLSDDRFIQLYGKDICLAGQRKRYCDALSRFEELFGEAEVSVFSAPGRTEIGGNHTDHQLGKVIAGALNVDAIAVAGRTDDAEVKVVSGDGPLITIDLKDLEPVVSEKGTTTALVKGVLQGLFLNGFTIGGFQAYVTSDVLIGSGISSSATFETLIGTVISGLYNDGTIPAQTIAMVGQYAENVYFGKPCGLMDQMASAVGSLVYIDFEKADAPVVERIDCDLSDSGYCLCITDTQSSHANCTEEYAAITAEMRKVAEFFGKEVLRQVEKEELFANLTKVREYVGDRAVLRAIHFMNENERVEGQAEALRKGDFAGFLKLVKASGDSSFKFLQNIYSNCDAEHQSISLALAVSESFLGNDGVCRVHGGGFAGTIQAYVKADRAEDYCRAMDDVFGEGACKIYQVRQFGGVKVF